MQLTSQDVAEAGRRLGRLTRDLVRVRKGRIGFLVVGGVIFLAVLAPLFAPHDPVAQSLGDKLVPPNPTYPLGTDEFGRDILSRILFGLRISILVGLVSVSIGVVIGVALGMVGGYYGGRIDDVVGRAIDIMLAFPLLLLALFIVAVLGQSLTNVMIAVGISTSPRFARLARGDTLSVKENPFVAAAKSLGRSNAAVMVEHVLPNIIAPIVVMASLNMGRAIIISAALSFIGLGIQPPTPSLGGILSDGREFMELAPWVSVFPGLAIMFTVLGFNLLGDALRDVLDPQLQQGGGFT